ncbi:hypothetical protein E2L08_05680 [Palleronia sediminis]|uniref:Uncharacterized protein n=1 Tax=Palleronia sediminis TaxID=2547833 RepID=A0A4R6AJK2_9RHOB|nr:hypothetical protein [Palleronia sediminis]TDL81603.1 hypothetical protein E2L08_05680 [Palleronia sediminis]
MSQTVDLSSADRVFVFALDLAMAEAERIEGDARRLARLFDGAEIDVGKAHVLDPKALAGLGLAAYLAEGEGVEATAAGRDRSRLDAVQRPVLILRPGAGRGRVTVGTPASLIGSYPLETALGDTGPVRSTSAETPDATAAPPPAAPRDGASSRRAGGIVAMIALGVALLITFLVWAISV